MLAVSEIVFRVAFREIFRLICILRSKKEASWATTQRTLLNVVREYRVTYKCTKITHNTLLGSAVWRNLYSFVSLFCVCMFICSLSFVCLCFTILPTTSCLCCRHISIPQHVLRGAFGEEYIVQYLSWINWTEILLFCTF